MTFLYLSCIEIALIYLLNIPKELFKRYIGMSLFVNGVVMMISSSFSILYTYIIHNLYDSYGFTCLYKTTLSNR